MTGSDAASRTPIALSEREVDLLQMGLVQYILRWREHAEADGGVSHPMRELEQVVAEAERLLRRLEQEAAPSDETVGGRELGVRSELGADVDPDHDTPVPGYNPRSEHSFTVWRLLPDGEWVGGWSEETRTTLAFRGQCNCGWEGPPIAGDLESGREDDMDRERVYDYWDRYHAPDWAARHPT